MPLGPSVVWRMRSALHPPVVRIRQQNSKQSLGLVRKNHQKVELIRIPPRSPQSSKGRAMAKRRRNSAARAGIAQSLRICKRCRPARRQGYLHQGNLHQENLCKTQCRVPKIPQTATAEVSNWCGRDLRGIHYVGASHSLVLTEPGAVTSGYRLEAYAMLLHLSPLTSDFSLLTS
jgi:hypothetical protein